MTWVTSNFSSAAGMLGAEAIDMRNWLLYFGCASEELRVVVSILDYLMANSPPLGHLSCTNGLWPGGAG